MVFLFGMIDKISMRLIVRQTYIEHILRYFEKEILYGSNFFTVSTPYLADFI